MIEKGLRGGMCQVSYKEARTNNKYMGEDYDAERPSKFINYLDANNLHGLATSMKLPIGTLKWMKKMRTDWTDNELEWERWQCLHTGSWFRVWKEIHGQQADYYPLAPENMKLEEKLLSKHQRELHRHYYNGKEARDEKQPKLILNQMDKTNYAVHIKALQFYLKKGMKLKQFHRRVKFKQRCWLKPWIDFNIEKRKRQRATLRRICAN